jgi:hypothetical protein
MLEFATWRSNREGFARPTLSSLDYQNLDGRPEVERRTILYHTSLRNANLRLQAIGPIVSRRAPPLDTAITLLAGVKVDPNPRAV